MRGTWTLSFIASQLRYMTLPSVMKLRDVRLREQRGLIDFEERISLQMKAPIRGLVHFRPMSSDQYIFKEVFVSEVYAPVLRRLKAAESIIDLGANIGLSSLYLGERYRGAKIFAVEPDMRNLPLLELNLQPLSRAGRGRIIHGAIWSSTMPLAMNGVDGGEYCIGTVCARQGRDEAPPVSGLTMNDVLTNSGFARVDLVKIDVEGAETELFKADLSWMDRVSCLAIEFHGDSRRQCDFDQTVRRRGFVIDDSSGHTVVAFRP